MDLRRFHSSSLADANNEVTVRFVNPAKKLPRLFRNLKARLDSLRTSKASAAHLKSSGAATGDPPGQESLSPVNFGLAGDDSPLPGLGHPTSFHTGGNAKTQITTSPTVETPTPPMSPRSFKAAMASVASSGEEPSPVSTSPANAIAFDRTFARKSAGAPESSLGWDLRMTRELEAAPAASRKPDVSVDLPPTPDVQTSATDASSTLKATTSCNTKLLTASSALPAAMARDSWSLKDYTISKRLQKGSYSAVYRATCRLSGLPVALKVYFLSRVPINVVHMLRREIQIQGQLVHKHIAHLYGAFLDEDDRVVLVQEYASRGDLHSILQRLGGRLTSEQAADVVRPLLEALLYMHSKGICHRDIKPENLLFSQSWRLLVADFGVSIDLNQERAVTRAGTEGYMAPEVERCPLKAEPNENKDDPRYAYSTAADIWAMGMLAYELLVGFSPVVMQAAAASATMSGFVRSEMTAAALHFPASVPPVARSFVMAALAADPGERPTAAQLLRHAWLQPAPAAVLAPRPAAAGEEAQLRPRMAIGVAVV